MYTKLINITDLYRDTLKVISTNSDEWISFLNCASMSYKYSFPDQVLIYAQKPNAIACATLEDWNNKFHRWVNKGSTGIALLTEDNGNVKLRYVFDVTDTNSRFGNNINLWRISKYYEQDVIEALENQFGVLEDKSSIALAIKSSAINMVEDNLQDYLLDLESTINDSNLSIENLEQKLKKILTNSVAYTMLKRSGINPNNYFSSKDFAEIIEFNTFDILTRLGIASNDISKLGLKFILKTIINVQKNEIDKIYTFDNKSNSEYDISKGRDNAERSEEDGENSLSNTRGLSDTEYSHQEQELTSKRNVRIDEVEIPKEEQESSIHNFIDAGQLRGTLDGNSNNSREENKTISGGTSEERQRDRGVERTRLNEVDTNDERNKEYSTGDSDKRTDIQLETYDGKGNGLIVPDSKVNQILSQLILKKTNSEIINFFKTEQDVSKRADYIKNAFNIEYTSISINEKLYGYKAFENGLLFWKGNFVSRDAEILINWKELTYHYDSMILLNQLNNRVKSLTSYKEQLSLFGETSLTEGVKELEFTDDFINKYLQSESIALRGKIYKQFQSSLSSKENIDFLKNLYGISGRSHTVRGSGIGDETDSKGITLERGYLEEKIERVLPWNFVEKRISELIRDDLYLSKEELEKIKEDNNSSISIETQDINNLEEKYGELDLIDDILYRHKIYDITTDYDKDGIIIAKDDDNSWYGKEFYDFLFNDVFVYNENGTVDLISDEKLNQLKEFRKKYDEETYNNDNLGYLIGKELKIGEREFVIESINNNEVSLMDKSLANVGFPTFRTEPLEKVLSILDETKIKPKEKKSKKTYLATFKIHPEINDEKRNNFKITDELLGVGSDREKFNKNIEAIKVLKKCEEENRLATLEEQNILSKYVGWGGLSKAFESDNSSWANEYLELKNILDEDEYKSAMESTLTSFYTPPLVINMMYKVLENIGIGNCNILEPSCGVGNFLGMIPNSMSESKIYGIEIDSISGRIARQLYQKYSIAVQGFEDTELPNSFFDGAIGNVPFGDFKVLDKKYDKNNFLIHDYFFAKTLDKVRAGGIIAFITSKGTLDKEDSKVRKYIAQRANLLGAIRLPDNTFRENAGTVVTSDIIFLQKRDSIIDIEPEWVNLDIDQNGIKMNKYFVDNPNMICGNMQMVSTQFGLSSTCVAKDDISLKEQLENAIQNIKAEVKQYVINDMADEEQDTTLPADYNVKNFSYTVVDGKLYYRENSRMYLQNLPLTTENRILGLIEIRDCTRKLIEYQTEDYDEEEIKREQAKLNKLYDTFTKKYGLINSRANTSAFSDDSSFYLLCSLEILDENKELKRKADMFTKRTILPHRKITKVDTANEALIVSISEKTKVDLEFMQSLCGLDMDKIISDLEGQIFNLPEYGEPNIWVTADEYLSGDIREKLRKAEEFAKEDSRFDINVKYLKESLPPKLEAHKISVRLGATWLPEDVIEEFIFHLLTPSNYVKTNVKVHYMKVTGEWNIEGKNRDIGNIKAYNTFGTSRVNAYKIIEDTLNLKDVRVYDYIIKNGNKKAELNKKETAIAQAKQEQIKNAFAEWIWEDQERRERLCNLYNELFNSIKPRNYNGDYIKFEGMNPEVSLRKHQKDAVARILYGGNTLLAHVVGAGKTFTMCAAAMESKRLGLCNKSMFVVPNHIVEQFGSEFLQLYPSANILVTTKKDFEKSNRKKFCSRIATGDYDAVIISHSQFEKIPMSIERQRILIEKQISDITFGIQDLKNNNAEKYSIKQLMKTQKRLETKLNKLLDQSRKDDVITFEELGVDRIFVDEAHYYKNLFLYTKMRNVGGIAQNEAQKSSDLFMKCQYLDELTGAKGVIFATGTPVSNTMAELYTMQRYLQYGELERRGLSHFDAWASTFGETVTALEIAPEGTGFRAKTRFAKFYNLPELIAMFKEVADIQTADMLNLPVPNAHFETLVLKPSEKQLEVIQSFAERAEKIRNREVKPDEDNMLKITNEGRKLSLDQRLINELFGDDDRSKVSECANNIYRIWNETKDKKSTQLIFCDLSTPKNDGTFNVYDETKRKLIEKGIPENEVEFIHNANTELQKETVFSKVRKGQIRVLLGSTLKMGAGTNCQDKIIAIHHLDIPWLPSWQQQREGRGIRQGNENKDIYVYNYVTEKTFDAYLFGLLENKQRFISQIMTSKTPLREANDIDETVLSYAEIKAQAAGNPLILEKTELDAEVSKLKLLKQTHLSQIYALEDRIVKYYPVEIKTLENKIESIKKDIEVLNNNDTSSEEKFQTMTLNGKEYDDKTKAGEMIIELCKSVSIDEKLDIGTYKSFKMELELESFLKGYRLILKNNSSYAVSLGNDPNGNITRINNVLYNIPLKLQECEEELANTKLQLENARKEVKRPFEKEEELKEKQKRLNKVNSLLNMNEKVPVIVDEEDEEIESQVSEKDYCR